MEFFVKDGHTNIEKNIDILLFADDLTILANDIVDLQSKLDTLSKYCRVKALEVNMNKTEVIKFKKAGRAKSERTIKYQGNPLKVVKRYTYLGVVFSSSGSFKIATNSAITKGQSALGVIWQILSSRNNSSWWAAKTLFNSVVTSTILYGAKIWGFNHTQEIERIQMMFYKRYLQLTRSTPGYVIRLEIGSSKLECLVLMSALTYWIKLLNLNAGRYPRRMYEKLKLNDNQPQDTTRFNLFSQLRVFLRRTGHEYLCTQESVDAVKLALPIIDGVLKNINFKDDAIRASQSLYCPLYRAIKHLEQHYQEPYLTLALPLPFLRMFTQTRLAGKITLSFVHNKIIYKICESECCLLCNLNVCESLTHILTECPVYENLRIKYLN